MNTNLDYRLECRNIVDPNRMRVRQHNTYTDLDCKRWRHNSIDLMKSPLECHCYNGTTKGYMSSHRNKIDPSQHLAHPNNMCNNLDCRLFDHNMFDMSPMLRHPSNMCIDLDCSFDCHNSIRMKVMTKCHSNNYTDLDCRLECHSINSLSLVWVYHYNMYTDWDCMWLYHNSIGLVLYFKN